MENNELKSLEGIAPNPNITITVAEYARLKDIETRFAILRDQMRHAEYCPIHTQVILGIEQECKQERSKQGLKLDLLP